MSTRPHRRRPRRVPSSSLVPPASSVRRLGEGPLRARGPADLLALVPSVLGFHPEDSIVLLTLGASARPLHARVDLTEDPDQAAAQAEYLAEVARRHAATAVAVIVYSDRPDLARRAVDALAAGLGADGPELTCALRADPHRWWLLRDDGEDGTGEPGTPYDVRAHPWMAQAVLDGTVVHRSRTELAESLVGHDTDETQLIQQLAEQAAVRLGALSAEPRSRTTRPPTRPLLVEEGHWVRERVLRSILDPARLEPAEAARLACALSLSAEVRDVAWAELTRATAQRHVDLWLDLTRRVPGSLRAPVASLLGFAAWVNGNGALAWCAVDRATQADPGYGLAALLTDVLVQGMPPSCWEPVARESLTLFAG